MSKGLIVVLVIVGLVLALAGWGDDLARFVGRRLQRAPALSLPSWAGLGAKLATFGAGGWIKLGAVVAVVSAIGAYPLLLRHETRRADRAETAVVDQIGRTQIAQAGGDLAGDQLGRAEDLLGARTLNRRQARQVQQDLEAIANADLPSADRAGDAVRELRERAARDHARAIADYRIANPARASGAIDAAENRRGT